MRNILLLIVFLLIGTASFAAQTKNTAPAVWERYKLGEKTLSIMFPKIPVKMERLSSCLDTKTTWYYAYAQGAVYEVRITTKESRSRPPGCGRVPEFGPRALATRFAELSGETPKPVVEQTSVKTLQGYKFTRENSTRWVLSDLPRNKRWIELAVTHYPDQLPNFERFVSSIESSDEGKEVVDGSLATLGDQADALGANSAAAAHDGPTSNLVIVVKPRPNYTDKARSANVRGDVRLKVTLLPNGAIGDITPVTELKFGLTEEAIKAARRIAFLPKRVNGVPVSIVMTFEYGFMIY